MYTCSPGTLKSAKAAAAQYGALFQIHVAETRAELDFSRTRYQCTPVALLDRLGILDKDTLLVHAVWLEGEEIGRIADSKAAVSHNPESNMKLASGIAPVMDLISAGVCVGLGTDGCASNNDLDLFSEMDSAAKLQKVASLNPDALDAATVLRLATIEGARAIGLHDRIGSIEVGKAADIIVVDTKKPRLTPAYDPYSLLVYAACGADVRHVLIAGKPVVTDGKLQTLDFGALRLEAEAVFTSIRKGLPPP